MSGQDKWLGKKPLDRIVLGARPGMSVAPSNDDTNGDGGQGGGGGGKSRKTSRNARANQQVMARRLDDRAEEIRSTLVKRTEKRRKYRRKKKKKKRRKNLSEAEAEAALLEPMDFMSKKKKFGCFGTIAFTEISGPGAAAARLFDLTDYDLRRIKACFDTIDVDESGSITQSEFFTILELTDTGFTRQLCNSIVFEIADSDQNNTLTFDEFVLGVCIVCTLTRDQLLYFVFRCFDLDDSGLLSHSEFVAMSEAINEAGGGFFDGNFSQLLEKFDANNDGNVDFGEFLLVDTYFPMAFYPVFRMQDMLQKQTLYPEKWMRMIAEYDRKEAKRAAERDIRLPFEPPRPFIERMVKLGAMATVLEERGGFNVALSHLKLGDGGPRSGRSGMSTGRSSGSGGEYTDRSDGSSESGTNSGSYVSGTARTWSNTEGGRSSRQTTARGKPAPGEGKSSGGSVSGGGDGARPALGAIEEGSETGSDAGALTGRSDRALPPPAAAAAPSTSSEKAPQADPTTTTAAAAAAPPPLALGEAKSGGGGGGGGGTPRGKMPAPIKRAIGTPRGVMQDNPLKPKEKASIFGRFFKRKAKTSP